MVGKKRIYSVVRVTQDAKKRLDNAKKLANTSFSEAILRYMPPENDIWKDELADHVDALKELFSQKKDILESIRYIILYSEELPDDLKQVCDEEVRARLSDLSHYVLAQKKKAKEGKRVLQKCRTEKRE